MEYQEFMAHIGKQIAQYRKLKFGEATYNEVAHGAKMRGTDWEAIERGEANPTMKILYRISVALDCEICDFFDCGERRMAGKKAKSKVGG